MREGDNERETSEDKKTRMDMKNKKKWKTREEIIRYILVLAEKK